MRKVLAVAVILLLCPIVQVLPFHSLLQPSSSLSSTYVREDSNLIYIGNGFIELQLLKTNGGIYSIVNKMTNEDYRTDKTVPARLFWAGEVNGGGFDFTSSNSFAYTYTSSANQSILTLTYSFSGTHPAVINTTIRVSRNSSLSYWRMTINNLGRAPLDYLEFPEISGISQVGNSTADNYLLIGDKPGSMLTNLYSTFITNSTSDNYFGFTYPDFDSPIQMMVLGNAFGGLYLSTYDASGNAKQFFAVREDIDPRTPTISLRVAHLFSEQVNSTVVVPYDTVLGVFSGTWYTAADMYRTWALRQWWTAQGSLYERSDLPEWFKRGFVTLNQEAYNTYDDPSFPSVANYVWANFSQMPVQLEQYLEKDNSPVITELTGWEKYGEWTAPDVFPPMEGWASFNATVASIHAMGQHVIVGLTVGNLRTWIPGFNKTWINCAIRERNGSLDIVTDFAPRISWAASPACPQFQDWVVNTITTLAAAGVDGVELDGTFTPSYDFGNSSTHPPGYGTWWTSAWINILERTKASVDRINPDFVLATEGLPETFIPWVEMYFAETNPAADYWVSVYGRGIALTGLVEYIYDGYAVGFSRQTWGDGAAGLSLATYDRERDFTQALGVSIGVVPNYASGSDRWDVADTSLSRSLDWAASSFFRDFLTFGQRIPPPEISVPGTSVEYGFYLSGPRSNQASSYWTPVVLAGAGISYDNRLGYIFVNIDNVSHSFTFAVDTSYLTQPSNLELLAMSENTTIVSPFDPSKPTIAVSVPPMETLTLQIVPSASVSDILQEYDAFKASFIQGMMVLSASTSGPKFDATVATTIAAENAYVTQDYVRSISLSLQAVNATLNTFARFGQLLSDEQAYSSYVTAFNTASNQDNADTAFDSAESAIEIGRASMSSLFKGVLFDQGHTDRATMSYLQSTPWFSYDRLYQTLESQGWNFLPETGLISSATLTNQVVAILPMPDRPFSQSEISAYLNFVRAGGGLIILGAWYAPTSTNALTDNFGIHFLGDTVTSTSYIGDKADFNVTNFQQGNPVTSGVKFVTVNYMTAVAVSSNVNVLAWTDSNTNSSTAKGPFPLVAVTSYGAGRVILIAGHLLDDSTIQEQYVGPLLSNSMDWASQPESTGNTLLMVGSYARSQRVDIGSRQAASFRFVRAVDGSYPAGVTIEMSNSSAIVSSSGWANFTVSQTTPQKSVYIPSSGSGPNGSLRLLVAGGSPVTIAWDEVVIFLNATATRTTVGSNATITWRGHYAYDNTPFSGEVVLNDTTTKTQPGVYTYTVGKVLDAKYNLTAFVSNSVSVTFISSQPATTTTSVTTTGPASTGAASSTTTTTGAGGGEIPEFPYQVVAIALFTVLLIVSYLAVRHRRTSVS